MNEDTVYQLLVADSTVTGLLGTYNAGGVPKIPIFPVEAEQGAPLPRVLYTLVTGNPANGFDVPIIDNLLVQVDVYGRSRREMRDLADAVRAALETTGTLRGIVLEEFEPGSKVYRRALSFSFWLNRT